MTRPARTARTVGGLVDRVLDVAVVPGFSRIGPAVRRRLPGWPADPPPGALAGTQVVVTGASSGLGLATAAGLAALGAHVHAVVRDPAKAARAVRGAGIEEHVTVWRCDLGDLADVTDLVERMHERLDTPLRALVHNAGAMPAIRTESPQGAELTMSLHVLGPVLLTDGLAPLLPGGIVELVSSGGMYAQQLRDDDPDYRLGRYSPTTAYARSKRAQVELLGLLQERWAPTTVAATHPGWADTPGVTSSLPGFSRLTGPILRTAEDGADTAVWLAATDEPLPGGLFWHDRRPRPTTWLGIAGTTDEHRRALYDWVCERIAPFRRDSS